jgi:hypothetical protein
VVDNDLDVVASVMVVVVVERGVVSRALKKFRGFIEFVRPLKSGKLGSKGMAGTSMFDPKSASR